MKKIIILMLFLVGITMTNNLLVAMENDGETDSKEQQIETVIQGFIELLQKQDFVEQIKSELNKTGTEILLQSMLKSKKMGIDRQDISEAYEKIRKFFTDAKLLNNLPLQQILIQQTKIFFQEEGVIKLFNTLLLSLLTSYEKNFEIALDYLLSFITMLFPAFDSDEVAEFF